VSIAGGFERAIDRAESLGAEALQIFVRSPRRWAGRAPHAGEAARFRDRLGATGLRRFALAHASYLINLAAPDREIRERSILAVAEELAWALALGIPALVLHPGSHLGAGEGAALDRVAAGLDEALAEPSTGTTRVLLEVTAGQGTSLGHRFSHLGRVIAGARFRSRLGVCFDTCHAVAAGYDLATARGYRRTMAELDRSVGLDRIGAFHLNDSRFPRASRRDRHEHIGRGAAGLGAFRSIVRDPRFRDLPIVLETPKGEDLAEDRENLAVLRRLAGIAR
jgi:deoxyribonuclease-4